MGFVYLLLSGAALIVLISPILWMLEKSHQKYVTFKQLNIVFLPAIGGILASGFIGAFFGPWGFVALGGAYVWAIVGLIYIVFTRPNLWEVGDSCQEQ